jgi:hypothetical protein
MNPTSALSSMQNSNPLLAILWAGFTCGTLDISAALVVYRYFGRPPMRLLQGIAAGVLGSRSFQGGLPTALLGLFCHFFIAFSAATVYLTASRWIPFLLAHAVISGVFYGVAVYFFMNRVVVPLSGAIKYPFEMARIVHTHVSVSGYLAVRYSFRISGVLRPRVYSHPIDPTNVPSRGSSRTELRYCAPTQRGWRGPEMPQRSALTEFSSTAVQERHFVGSTLLSDFWALTSRK